MKAGHAARHAAMLRNPLMDGDFEVSGHGGCVGIASPGR